MKHRTKAVHKTNSADISLFVTVPGIAGFEEYVDDNGDVEFNMTLLEFVKNESGVGGKALV